MNLCAGHQHPSLPRPISRAQFEKELAGMYQAAGLNGAFTVGWPRFMDERHKKSPRSYAQVTTGRVPAFEFTKAVLSLPPENRSALMAHEIGHVLTPNGSETDADAAGSAALGIPIAYDTRWPSPGLQTMVGGPHVSAARNPYDDGFEPPNGELAQPGEQWLTGCRRSVATTLAQDLGAMSARQVSAEGDCSEAAARATLQELERMGAAQASMRGRAKVYTLMPSGRDLAAWIAYRDGLDAADATSFDFGPGTEADPWDWSVRDTGTVEIKVSPPAEEGMEPYVIRAWSSLHPTYPIGELEFWPSASQTHDPRRFGAFGPDDYAPITALRVHPAFRRLGIATQLVLRAAHEAALRGVPIASPDDRTQSEGRWWSRHADSGKAKLVRHRAERGHPGASRYVLTESLANPPSDRRALLDTVLSSVEAYADGYYTQESFAEVWPTLVRDSGDRGSVDPRELREQAMNASVGQLRQYVSEFQRALENPGPRPRSKLCQQGRHDFDPVTAACRRSGCPATLTLTMFPMTVKEEEQAYGFSAERAAQGFKAGEEQLGLFNPPVGDAGLRALEHEAAAGDHEAAARLRAEYARRGRAVQGEVLHGDLVKKAAACLRKAVNAVGMAMADQQLNGDWRRDTMEKFRSALRSAAARLSRERVPAASAYDRESYADSHARAAPPITWSQWLHLAAEYVSDASSMLRQVAFSIERWPESGGSAEKTFAAVSWLMDLDSSMRHLASPYGGWGARSWDDRRGRPIGPLTNPFGPMTNGFEEIQAMLAEKARLLEALIAALPPGTTAAAFRRGRHPFGILIHPTSRPDAQGRHQITRMDEAGEPTGHSYGPAGGGFEGALRAAWREWGPFELVGGSLKNPPYYALSLEPIVGPMLITI